MTGSNFTTEEGRYVLENKEIDPFGTNVTKPPTGVLLEPSWLDPHKDFFWPVEYEANWTGEAERGMAEYASRVNADYDRRRAEYFWNNGRRDIAIEIVSNNPNVGIQFGKLNLFGAAAAAFLAKAQKTTEKALKELAKFLKENPKCAEVIQHIGQLRGLPDFLKFMSNTLFIHADENDTVLDQSPADVGPRTAENDTMYNRSLRALLYDKREPAYALAHPGINTIFLSNIHFNYKGNPTSLALRGSTIFHEGLHNYLKATHSGILKAIGLPIPMMQNFKLVWRTSRSGVKIPETEYEQIPNDEQAGRDLNAWIDKKCSN
jgi:hypothetical protein